MGVEYGDNSDHFETPYTPADEEKIATEYCIKKGLVMIPMDYWKKVIAYENRDTLSPGRKTGKWISLRTGGSGKSTTVKLYPICSECGFEHSPVNYCPNCGAKMDSWIVDFAMTAEGANDV